MSHVRSVPPGRRRTRRGAGRPARGRRRLPGAALPVIAALAAVVLASAAPAAAAASQVPSSVLCMGWASCASLGYPSYGYATQGYQSYWQMSPGDECTNYVAYVESQGFGAPAPGYLLGNGGQWAASAAANGVTVNDVPSVGAVAEWNGGSFGVGPLGHVAVVQKVGPDDSYIDISQQNIGSAVDGYEWVQINAGFPATSWQEWPDNFIHFAIRGQASVGYYNPQRGSAELRESVTASADMALRLGRPGMVPVVGSWNGRSPGIGYYDPATGGFHLRSLGAARPARPTALSFRFGPPGMTPLAGRWTGRGADGIGYYDPRTGTFHLRDKLSAGPANYTFAFGPPGMVPLIGNWDGKGGDGIGYYDPRTGIFRLRNSLSAGRPNYVFAFGRPGMIPVVGNWNGGTVTGVGLYDSRTGWFRLRDRLGSGPAGYAFRFGPRGMIPLAGDWLG